MINEDALKQRIQRWIVCGSVAIMAGKFLAFWLTNSVGILTDAVESIVNVTAGFSTACIWPPSRRMRGIRSDMARSS